MSSNNHDLSYFMAGLTEDNSSLIGEASEFKALVSLLVSDRVRFPYLYSSPGEVGINVISGVPDRQRALIEVFSHLLSPAVHRWDYLKLIAEKTAVYLASLPYDELLHVPGRFHEASMSHKNFPGQALSRKKQGSYYTPGYAVRYMVKRSFEYLYSVPVQRKLMNLRVLDPACGGASFLLEIFRYLLNSGFDAEETLQSLYGVDLDGYAVDLSMFILTVEAVARGNMKPAHVKSALERQIKKGNALKLDWFNEFPEIFQRQKPHNPGFDMVIGNPPYVANKLIPVPEKNYYKHHYSTAVGQFDLAVPFLEQGLNLLREGGLLCYITSNKFLAADYGKELRKKVLQNYRLLELTDVSTTKTFIGTAVYPVVVMIEKTSPGSEVHPVRGVRIYNVQDWSRITETTPTHLSQNFFALNSDYLLTTQINNRFLPIIKKIAEVKGRIPRKTFKCGLAMTGFNNWVVGGNADNGRPFIQAGHIKAYGIREHDWIDTGRFDASRWMREKGPKLVVPGIAKQLVAAVDYNECIPGRVYYVRQAETDFSLNYLMALMNSFVLGFYYKIMYWPVHLEGGYLRFNSGYLSSLPVWCRSWEEGFKRELVNKITELAKLIAETPPEERSEPEAHTQAGVFRLFGIDSAEAELIMDYLEIPKETKERVMRQMKGRV